MRYRQLHSLHEQLKKDLGGSTLPPFPPKKLLPLSSTQTEERRATLEKYILQCESSYFSVGGATIKVIRNIIEVKY